MKTAYFNRFSISMPQAAVDACSHSGACDSDVAHWQDKIQRPADATPQALAAELKEYGAWTETELKNDAANWQRIIWIAAGNIKDDNK